MVPSLRVGEAIARIADAERFHDAREIAERNRVVDDADDIALGIHQWRGVIDHHRLGRLAIIRGGPPGLTRLNNTRIPCGRQSRGHGVVVTVLDKLELVHALVEKRGVAALVHERAGLVRDGNAEHQRKPLAFQPDAAQQILFVVDTTNGRCVLAGPRGNRAQLGIKIFSHTDAGLLTQLYALLFARLHVALVINDQVHRERQAAQQQRPE
ncbi:MAG: hypothetical protein IPG06_10885 [Haliea sp.]|nr:hypothetical protein [Haliea sp.]